MKKKKITFKNYAYLFLIVISVVALTFYIRSWYNTYKAEKLETSPMENVVEKIDINEIRVTVSEMNEVLLYFGYLKNEKIHFMEQRILNFLKKEDLTSKLIYVDVTEYMSNNEYKNIISQAFPDSEIDPVLPMILYVKSGKVIDNIKPEYGLIQTYQIKDLINKYDLSN